MDFTELIRKARSYRRYVERDPIPPDVVTRLVDAARLVPSGGNQQPLRYRIVTEPAERAAVFARLKWAAQLKDWGGPAEGERPTAYIIITAAAGRSPAMDVGIAAYAIQLAATDAGYAACMLGNIDHKGLRAALGIPENMDVQLVVALGRPGETIVLEDPSASGGVVYYRTPDGVHHVPKRRLHDVLIR